MKIKRYKHARRILNFYKRNFGLREPYQIIGEPSVKQKQSNALIINFIIIDLVAQYEVGVRPKGFSILIV